MSRTSVLVASLIPILSGCVASEDPVAPDNLARISPNGTSANGINLGGTGVSLAGVRPRGISARGVPIGITDTGAPLVGPDLVGSRWMGRLTNGLTAPLRIDAAQQGTDENADVWSYRVLVKSNGAWRPLCLDPVGGLAFADTVRGTWNLAGGVPGGGSYHASTTDFTIACRGSAIAKCLEFGYKPWTGNARELAACVRALRGDYCGDGTLYTIDGTTVNIYDDQGIQPDGVDWEPEAEWTPAGAVCVSKQKVARFSQTGQGKPWCYPHRLKQDRSCGADFGGDVVIITEQAPR
jgi:hypothetical protein